MIFKWKSKCTYANGSAYEGEWQNGKEHGKGTYTYPDGSVYEGEWQNGKEHGQGTCTYASGSAYEGEWQNGKKHGKGKFKYADGSVYEGEWQNGQKYGQGKYTYANGSAYEGEWQNGNGHGKGTYTYPDDSAYEGEWQNGKKYGKGTYTYPDGGICKVKWKEDGQMDNRYKLVKMYWVGKMAPKGKEGENLKQQPVIESTQSYPAYSCFEHDGFYDVQKYLLQSIGISSIVRSIAGYTGLQSGVDAYDQQEIIVTGGFGTSVFGIERIENVFLNPKDITPEQIICFLEQLAEKDLGKYTLIAYSASGPSFMALSSFLQELELEHNKELKDIILTKLEGGIKQAENLENLVSKRTICVNPPGILYIDININSSIPIISSITSSITSRKTQSCAVDGKFVSEGYFTNMIEKYLSGGFELWAVTDLSHSGAGLNPSDYKSTEGAVVISSVTDEMVFPFYYVAEFAKELQDKTQLDDKIISKLVYKIMQYGDLDNFTGNKENFIINFLCSVKSSTEYGNCTSKNLEFDLDEMKNIEKIVEYYLQLRDNYLACQSMHHDSEGFKKVVKIFENHEQVRRPKPPSVRCQPSRSGKLNGDEEEQELFSI